jgi:colicin import membrane protein
MEGPVKRKQAFLYCAIALSLLTGLAGCKGDSAAVDALGELTTQLSEQVSEQNKELSALTEKLETCMKDLATAKDEAVVITSSDATGDVPSLEGEANLASLGALKEALNDTLAKQKSALAELTAKNEQCAKDLQAVRDEDAAASEAAAAAEAEAAAAAELAAAEKAAAAKKRKPAPKKPTAVKEAEKTGAPTKGTRSRY